MVTNPKQEKTHHQRLSLKVDNAHSMVEFFEGISSITHHHDVAPLIDVSIVLENWAAVNKLSGKTTSPLMIDFTSFTTTHPLYTPTARTILFGHGSVKKPSAIAFLFAGEDHLKKSFLFHSSNKDNIPFKMFTNKNEAILWLKSFTLN